ncbi:MAG: hypothetical protein MUP30_07000 [Deltaproteobacteria bacterium]|nr:hypothetical protein [Deltaproteobacteria bacterium]
MKRKFVVVGAFVALAVSISGTACAKSKDLPCQSTALKVATYVDNLGWGKVASEPLQVERGKDDGTGNETFKIKSTVSGYVYTVETYQDSNTGGCVVTSLSTQ